MFCATLQLQEDVGECDMDMTTTPAPAQGHTAPPQLETKDQENAMAQRRTSAALSAPGTTTTPAPPTPLQSTEHRRCTTNLSSDFLRASQQEGKKELVADDPRPRMQDPGPCGTTAAGGDRIRRPLGDSGIFASEF